jgi:hypothetical protein
MSLSEALWPALEQRGGTACWAWTASKSSIEDLDRGEMAGDQRIVGERAQVRGWLECWRTGWQEVQRDVVGDVVGDVHAPTGVPAGAVEDQDARGRARTRFFLGPAPAWRRSTSASTRGRRALVAR